MMSESVKIKIEDENGLKASLNGFSDIVKKNQKKILEAVGSKLLTFTTEVFDSEGADGGGKWVALKDSTVKSREKKYAGRKILYNEGDLKASLLKEVSDTFAAVKVAGEDEYLGKARAHQFGTDKAGRKKNVVIPARPFLVLTERITKEIEEDISEFVKKKMNEAVK